MSAGTHEPPQPPHASIWIPCLRAPNIATAHTGQARADAQVCGPRLALVPAVVDAVSGDEDYAVWLLFEIPGGDWFFVDPLCLPGSDAATSVAMFAREHVTLTSLWPHGVFVSADASGDPIPHRGGGIGDYAEADARRFVWRPEEASLVGNADGMVPESSLPAWMRD